MRRRPWFSGVLVTLTCALGAAAAGSCANPEEGAAPPQQASEGTPRRGAELIDDYGCVTCHTVPGIDGADGLVGPPLDHFARRTYIAGELVNSEHNLQHWIEGPQVVEPGTAMPDLDVSGPDAADIVAYLYTLR